jgi:hypothetical protein
MARMPRYLVVRKFEVTEDAMPSVGRRSREIVEGDFPEITWEHSHVIVEDSGSVSTYCVYEAPDEDTVRRHGEQLGQHRITDLWEIAGDVTPDDFPPVAD